MSENKEKKFNKLFKSNMKEKITEAAFKIVDEKMILKMKTLEYDEWKTARQRDWFIIISAVLLITNIIFIWAWAVK